MSKVTVRYLQRVLGRIEGSVETVEHTPFLDGLIANNRIEVLEVHADPEPEPEPVVTPEEAMAETLTKPGPRPSPRIGDSRRKLADG